MNKIEELIQRLCPNGVEFVKLWTVTIWDKKFNTVERNKQAKVISYPYLLAKELFLLEQDKGNVFLLSTGEQVGWTTEKLAGDYLCEGEVVTIPWGKSRKVSEVMKYYKGKFITADNRIATSSDLSVLSNKYLYYWMLTQGDNIDKCYRGAGIQHPDMSKILDFEIPLPPIEVQNEIVRILDSFTSLAAELKARREQYEYYRNELLSFEGKEDVEWMTMGEVYDMKAGKSIIASEIMETKTLEYPYPCYGGNGLRGYVSDFNQQGKNVLIGRQGALCGNVCFASGSYYATEHAVVVSEKGYSNPRYTFHLLTMMNLNQYKTAGAQPGLSVSRLERISIPIPPLTEQERIVSILDKFEALVNDLSQGLPAEIAAVQEQYEYYRNRLLTFQRAS